MLYLHRTGFGSAVCVQRDRYIEYLPSQTADPNPLRGKYCMNILIIQYFAFLCYDKDYMKY